MGFCYKCDRCGKLISSVVYKVDMSAYDINSNLCLSSCEAAGFNISQRFKQNERFCRECIQHIQNEMRPIQSNSTEDQHDQSY